MLKVAITGNIASGKSQVETILSEKYNYKVFDSDKIAHEILEKITDFYGYDIFTNGKPDRKKLGNLVFSDQKLRKKLEEIIHPKVKEEILKIFEKYKNEKFVFVSVPLLFETGFDKLFDKIIMVTVDKETQLTRLMKRNNLSEPDAKLRINSQISQEEKIKNSDFVINNDSTLERLDVQIKNVIEQL